MKILSFNCRGLMSPQKKLSLKSFILRLGLDVLFLQETLGSGEAIKEALQTLLPRWEFMTLDAKGWSRGFATGWRTTLCRLSSSWGCDSCLGMELLSQELNSLLRLVNVYGPYQDRVGFWDKLFSKSFSHENVIMGGDPNLTLGVAEIWGPKAIPDPLSDFFQNHLAQLDLFYIDPIKLNPTWRNRRVGEHVIMKRLDRFLVGEDITFPVFTGSTMGGVGW